jgi:acetyl esterase/lipase
MPLSAQLDVVFGAHPQSRVDVFVPDRSDSRALVALYAGGWWTAPRREELRSVALVLAAQGWPVAVVGVRPLALATGGDGARNGAEVLVDARAGLDRAIEEAGLLGLPHRDAILVGSGSGSLVALTLGHRLAVNGGKNRAPRVRGVVAAGVTPSLDKADIAHTHHMVAERFAGSEAAALSPMGLDPADFPDLMLLHGDGDGDVSGKVVARFRERFPAETPVEFSHLTGLGHQFLEDPHGKGRSAVERLAGFLDRHGQIT